jgi:hypothetical protein
MKLKLAFIYIYIKTQNLLFLFCAGPHRRPRWFHHHHHRLLRVEPNPVPQTLNVKPVGTLLVPAVVAIRYFVVFHLIPLVSPLSSC